MTLLKPKFIIIMAGISGALATYGISNYLQNQALIKEKEIVLTKPVVIATQDISIGVKINHTMIQKKEWPIDLIPGGSFSDSVKAIGRVVKTDLVAGEPILTSKLAPDGSIGGVSSLIPPGMRAITVAVNIVSGVAGFILPNTRVDVLTTINPSRSSQATTKIILQNVLVLAVDQTYRKNSDDPVTVKSITLLVTPEEAETLTLASTEGRLHLVLRNESDNQEENTRGVGVRQLLTGRRNNWRYTPQRTTPITAADEQEKTTARVVEIIRSNERSEVKFEEEAIESENK